jgi:hypothetical protein
MKKHADKRSRYPHLTQIVDAMNALRTAEERLMVAGMVDCAGIARNARELADAEFTTLWEAMLRVEGRWSEGEASKRLVLAKDGIYVGEIDLSGPSSMQPTRPR